MSWSMFSANGVFLATAKDGVTTRLERSSQTRFRPCRWHAGGYGWLDGKPHGPGYTSGVTGLLLGTVVTVTMICIGNTAAMGTARGRFIR